MKLLTLISAVLMTSVCFADSIVVLETKISRGYERPQATAKFFMDTRSEQGFANVSVVEYVRDRFPRQICDRYGCYPVPTPPMARTVFSDRVEIPNLNLINKQMIYTSESGEQINCGRLGRSRVMRTPTLYLSGNCELVEKLDYDKLTVTFVTK